MKNVLRLAVGGTILLSTGLVVIPEEAHGWSTIGGSLGLTQRDFRIFDNFTDSQAHNNNQADPNWPGYTQIELACWKAGAEWGSRLHGDGSGDPTQGGVGDGRGNFNFYWNGEASGVGGTNDNINSELSGGSGGVLAFTETPISNGWRIRYYSSWTWHDGPGSVSSGIDFQGVACHELGHALGLGHSSVGGATMFPSISGSGVGERSIQPDDRDGLTIGIYGFRDDNVLPRIADLTGSFVPGGTAVVTGANYTTTSNRIWFNSSTLNGGNSGGEPFELTNLNSTNGQTQISFTVPSSGIETGLIHVRKGGSGNDRLSESHPFDLGGGTCGGSDTITLSGDTSASPGDSVSYSWTGAPATGSWTLYYSLTQNGNGCLDIGPNLVVAATGSAGTTNFAGNVPNGAPTGITAFIELQAIDGGGAEFDSNVVALAIN